MNPFQKYIKGETALHIAVCEYVSYQYPEVLIHHSPNEGKRSPFERYLIKRMNVSSGFPDLMFVGKGKILFLELKYGNNIPSESQMKWLSELWDYENVYSDVCSAIAWSFESAKKIIDTVIDEDKFYSLESYRKIFYDKHDLIPKKFLKIIKEI